MSKSGFFNKVPRQGIFWRQHEYLLSWLCFDRCLLLPFLCFLFTLYSVVYLEEEGIVSRSYSCRPLTEIRDKFNGRLFLEITMFLGQKIYKTGTDSQL